MLNGLIFANGDLNDGPAVRAALAQPGPRLIIAADGGLRHALALALRPDLVIGDMDSVDALSLTQVQAEGAEIARHPAHKNETDLELALIAAAKRGCDPIRLIGALGSRFDQTLSNVYLLALPALRGRDVKLVSGRETTWLAYPGEIAISGQPGDTLSLIPLAGEAVGITTQALAYPLRGETLYFGPARGVSNEMLGHQACITFVQGILLIVHTAGKA